MAKVTKTQITIRVMNENADKPMAEVVSLIAKANDVTEAVAKGAYRWCVNKGLASGVLGADRPSKAPKAKVEKASKKLIAKAKAELNVDEIAKIKEANLARMKEVSAKLKPKGKVRDFGDRVAAPEGAGVDDFDPTLAREEINSILRDERLIDVCPKFVREDV